MSNRQRLLRPSLLVLILACLLPNGVPGAETPDGAGVVIGLKTAASGYGVGDTVSVKLEIRGA